MAPTDYKILVVEDNFINQKLINKLLIKKGYNVTLSSNGKQALEICREQKFDLVLMDIQMPLMDGFEATLEIRNLDKADKIHTPIVAVTAFAMETDRQKCFEVGMDDYISKPFTKEDFYAIVEKNLPKTE